MLFVSRFFVLSIPTGCREEPNIIAISAGYHYTIGLTRDGTVVATGFNKFDQCNVEKWRDIRHQLTLD